jgi:hypothetical protein
MSTGRAFPFVTLLVMSALMSLSGITLKTAEQVAPSAEAIDRGHGLLLNIAQRWLTCDDHDELHDQASRMAARPGRRAHAACSSCQGPSGGAHPLRLLPV